MLKESYGLISWNVIAQSITGAYYAEVMRKVRCARKEKRRDKSHVK